jgi:protein-L-isoaspartate(D-aspartate) O-methyltransferase
MEKVIVQRAASLIFLFLAPAAFFPTAQNEEVFYAKKRREMVEQQLRARDITDRRVLEVMGQIPRHLFIPPSLRGEAYEDFPLPIEEGQTISQPYIVALMTQCLELKGNERVLEVGTGSGYQAAVLSQLAALVYSIEISEPLAKKAADTLRGLGYNRVEVKCGDGYFGWPERAPFDAVIVTCAASRIPDPLFQQLREGGRLIIPIGQEGDVQTLTLVRKIKDKLQIEHLSLVRFVPMTGEDKKKKK